MAEVEGLMRATTALVVTYGDRGAAALEAVAAAAAAGAGDAVIVLNGSSPDATRRIEDGTASLPVPTALVVLPENLGSAGGFAAGIAAALRPRDRSFIWILDDDNRPTAGALGQAFTAMLDVERTQGAGLVAVSCARPADRLHSHLLAGHPADRIFDRPGAFLHFDVRGRLLPRRPAAQPPGSVPQRLEAAPYGGLVLPAPLVRRIGMPRADLVLYEDDVEYTSRIVRAGAALVFAPSATVHETDKPVGPADGAQEPVDDGPRPLIRMLRTPPAEQHRLYYQYRNRAFLDRQAASGGALPALMLNGLGYLGAVAVAVAVDRRNRVAVRTFVAAVRDGMTGRLGLTRPLGGSADHS